jgi:DNA-binding transcriptional MocR family regulator
MKELLRQIQFKYFIEWSESTGGMSIWLNLNRDSEFIGELAKKKGILFQVKKNMRYENKYKILKTYNIISNINATF